MKRNNAAGRKATCRQGFTLLEVLVALAILSISLMALHQAFSSTVYVNTISQQLWRAILYSNNELARIERGTVPEVSVSQGEYPEGHPLFGYSWRRNVTNEEPFPGVKIRKIALELTWEVGAAEQRYKSEVYVRP